MEQQVIARREAGEFRRFPYFARMFDLAPAMPRVFDDEMKVEEYRDADHIVVRAELPGIDPDRDVQVNVRGHTLEIRADRRETRQDNGGGNYRSEFRYGSFTRYLPLPSTATDRDVAATYKDGILEVRVPVDRDEERSARVPVTRA